MGLKRVAVRLTRKMSGFDILAREVADLRKDLESIKGLLRAINHRAALIEEIAPRISTLDNVNHRLQDFDAAALVAAGQIAADTESVAVMVKLVEKLLADLTRQLADQKS